MRRFTITCAQCGLAVERDATAKYCFPCSQERVRNRVGDPGRKRAGVLQPRKVDGVWTCLDCNEPVPQPVYDGKRRRPRLRCSDCFYAHNLFTLMLSGRAAASGMVGWARRRGVLPAPTEFACADCGRPAEQYDHRDYGRPLEVEPVCRSCNVIRGPARPLDQRIVLGLLSEAVRAHGISLCPIEPLNATQRS